MRIFIAAAFFAACSPVSAEEMLPGPYPVEIVRVIDGDTVEARIHIWLGLDQITHIRLRGIDAPELHGHCPGEREAAVAARDHLAYLLDMGPVTVTEISKDKYGGRIDARLRRPDGTDISAIMLKAGHALPSTRSRVRRC
jgi:micrococcal nuclease